MNGTVQLKEEWRRKIRAWRRSLNPDWVRSASEGIIQRVVALDEFRRAHGVGCYVALPGEVQTDLLLEWCWNLGKKVAVPAFDKRSHAYRFSWLKRGGTEARGAFGIIEPEPPAWTNVQYLDFVVVPGVAFDRSGRRLGRGGGHYDQLLASCRGFKVGLAFEGQMVETVPVDAEDISLNAVVTERRLYMANKNLVNEKE